jgi:serine/threonine protein kinase/tetratricopeptide (TPR) repeat protein
MIGKTISHYRIVEKLGEGGMGVVYKAEDTKLKRSVALKFLPRELDAHEPERARFLQEARAASALNHPNICNVHALGEHLGQQFIDMEFVDGVTLRGKIQEAGMKIQEAIAYAIQIGEALQEAHSKGVVHRDVKPENIMVNTKNQIKVMDFGLAKLKGSLKLTKTSSTVGTLAYMAPEQIEGREVDARSDIFSFGIVLYEMLTGKRPFRGDQEGAMINSILNDDPEPIQKYCPDVSSEVIHILGRALEKDPEDRYPNVHEMLIDLRRAKKETSRVSRRSLATVTAEQPLPSAPGAVEVPPDVAARAGELGETRERPPWRRLRSVSKKLFLGVGLAVLIIAAGLTLYLVHPFKSSRPVTKRIIVVPFENQTGDPSLDPLGRMVADWATQSLLQSGLAEVVPPERLRDLQKNQSVGSIAEATGASTIVMGSYYKVGENIQFQAKVLDADGKILQAIEPVSSQAAQTMDAVEGVRQGVLGAIAPLLDERLREFWGHGGKPPNYEAYQQYIQGFDLFHRHDYRGALEYFKLAYAADTSSVTAVIHACYAYWNLGQVAQADSVARILSQRRAQIAPLEQLMLDEVNGMLAGDHTKALDAMRKAGKMAPRSTWAYEWGYDAYIVNRPQECIEALASLDPEQQWSSYWGCLAGSYHLLGEYKRELEVAREARKRFPTELGLLNTENRALVALGRIDEVKKLVEESLTFSKQQASPGGTMRIAAEELRAHGHEEAAMAMLDQAIQWNKSRPVEEMTASRREGYAITLYDARRWDEAKSVFEELASKSPKESSAGWGYEGWLGLIAARQGDRVKAMAVSEWLKGLKLPYLFGGNTYNRACIAALLGDKDQAITLLKESFLQGETYNTGLHRDFDFESLWDYPPFKEILKPKG